MKRTNIVLDESLVRKAGKLSGLKTKREIVDAALRDFVRRNDQRKLLELRGIGWEGDLKAMRKSRVAA